MSAARQRGVQPVHWRLYLILLFFSSCCFAVVAVGGGGRRRSCHGGGGGVCARVCVDARVLSTISCCKLFSCLLFLHVCLSLSFLIWLVDFCSCVVLVDVFSTLF